MGTSSKNPRSFAGCWALRYNSLGEPVYGSLEAGHQFKDDRRLTTSLMVLDTHWSFSLGVAGSGGHYKEIKIGIVKVFRNVRISARNCHKWIKWHKNSGKLITRIQQQTSTSAVCEMFVRYMSNKLSSHENFLTNSKLSMSSSSR